jgi:hypothetical protein
MKNQNWPNTHNTFAASSAPEYTEAEIGILTDEEYEAARLRHERFLLHEQEEMETLEQEFDEELNQLFSLTHEDEIENDQTDPPGWPGL